MPLDPVLARGITPLGEGVPESLSRIGLLRQRDNYNALQQQEFAATQQSEQRKQLVLQQFREMMLYDKAPPAIKGQYVALQRDKHSEFASTPFATMPPEQAFEAMKVGLMAELGMQPDTPEAPPGPITYEKTPWGGQLAMQDGKKIADWNPPAPQQYGPESFNEFTQADGSVVLVGNRGTIRPTTLKGQPKGGGSGVTVGPNGELVVNPDPAKATEGERVSANYLGRMEAAEKNLGDFTPGVKDYTAARIVMQRGPIAGSLANNALSPEAQLYYQAAADWVRAKLRKESGAVIAPEEMEQEIKTYFPIPGDTPETIAQKKQARKQATDGMRQMGGRAVTSGRANADSGVVDFNDL